MGCHCSDSKDRAVRSSTAPVSGNPLLSDTYPDESDLLLKGHYQENDEDNSLECSSNSSCVTSNVAISHACHPTSEANKSKQTNITPRNVKVCSYQRSSTNKSDASSKSIDEPTLKQSISPPIVKDENASDTALEPKKSPVVCQENHIFTCRLASPPMVDTSVTRVLGIDMLDLPSNGKDEDKASSRNAIAGNTLSLVGANSIESTSVNTTTEPSASATTSGDQPKDTSIIEKQSPSEASSHLHLSCTEPKWDNTVIENHLSAPETLSAGEQLMDHILPQKNGNDIECELSHSNKRGNIQLETSKAEGEGNNTPSSIKIPLGDTLSLSNPNIGESINENIIIEDSVPAQRSEGETKDMPSSVRTTTGDISRAIDPKIETSTWDNSIVEFHIPSPAPALECTRVRTEKVMEELPRENQGHGLAQRRIEDTGESSLENKRGDIDVEICAALKKAEDKPSSNKDIYTHDTYLLKQDCEKAKPDNTIVESPDWAAPLEGNTKSALVTKTAAEGMTLGNQDCAKSAQKDTIIESDNRASVETKADSCTSFTHIATDDNVKVKAITNIGRNSCFETANAVSRLDAWADFSTTPILYTIDNKVEGDAMANATKSSFTETWNGVKRDQSPRQEYQNYKAEEYPVDCNVNKPDSFHATITDGAEFYDRVIKDVQDLKCFIGDLRRDLFSVIEAKDQVMAGAEKEVISADSINPWDHMKSSGTAEPKPEEERASNTDDLQKQFRSKVSNNFELPPLAPIKNGEHQGNAGEKSSQVKDSDNKQCALTLKSVRKEVDALKCFIGDLARDLSSAIKGRTVSAVTERELPVENSIDPSYLVRTNGKVEHETWKPRGRDNQNLEREEVKNNFELPTSVSNKWEEHPGESNEGSGDVKKDMIANDNSDLEISCPNYRDAKDELTIKKTDSNAAEQQYNLTFHVPELKTSFSSKHPKNPENSRRESVVPGEGNKRKEYSTTEHEDQDERTVKRVIGKAIDLAVEQLGKELSPKGSSKRRRHTLDLQIDGSTKSPIHLELSPTQLSKGSISREFGIFIVMIMFLIIQNYYISVT